MCKILNNYVHIYINTIALLVTMWSCGWMVKYLFHGHGGENKHEILNNKKWETILVPPLGSINMASQSIFKKSLF
jgi:hypothetical protein